MKHNLLIRYLTKINIFEIERKRLKFENIYAKIYIALIYIAILCPPLADIKIYSYLLFIADRLLLDEGGGGRGIK